MCCREDEYLEVNHFFKRKLILDSIANVIKLLYEEEYDKCVEEISKAKRKAEELDGLYQECLKRAIQKGLINKEQEEKYMNKRKIRLTEIQI